MIALKNLSSAILNKGQYPSGMGRLTFMTVLGQKNKRITIISMYRPDDTSINATEKFTVVKQQWLIMQKKGKDGHPHKAVQS